MKRVWPSVPIALALALAMSGTALGATVTFDVDSVNDLPDAPGPPDGICKTGKNDCSLRAAIRETNALTGSNQGLINLPAGTYKLTTTGTNENADASGDLDITRGVLIVGAGARTTIIDGNKTDGVFDLTANGGNTTISGVTIQNGLRPAATSGQTGAGGVNNLTVETTLNDVVVRDNSTTSNSTLGGGIYNAPSQTLVPVGLRLNRVLVSGNTSATPGGGIYNEGQIVIQNSTFTNNTSTFATNTPQGAGAIEESTDANGALTIDSSTFANNHAQGTRGADINQGSGPVPTVTGTILGSANACNKALGSGGSNIDAGATCALAGAGDHSNTDPQLGPLQDNGGPSDTFLPALASPAVDTRTAANCPAVDQRGVARPVSTRCDIGAVEFDAFPPPPPPPTTPGSIALSGGGVTHLPGVDVAIGVTSKTSNGSPSSTPLAYSVAGANPAAGTVTPDSAGNGSVTLTGVHDGTDTLTVWYDANGDNAAGSNEPSAQTVVNWVLPAPVIAKTVNLEPVTGKVLVKLPSGPKTKVSAAASFIPLEEAKNVPIGTIVDARRGRVELSAAVKKGSTKTQAGQFYSGQFAMTQQRNSPYMELQMNESLTCPKKGSKVTAARAKKRQLWGSDKGGKFRTKGRHSTATVRGTVWLTKDTCTTTTTVVREGSVVVKDVAKHKNVKVKAGHRYVARAKKPRR